MAAQSMYAVAFHEMRVGVGRFPDSVVAQPSEQERLKWQEEARDRYVYVLDEGIVGYSHLWGNEICSVSVQTDFQRRGIGRKFVMYLCNEIYRRGHTNVALSCVVGNDARKLYDSLGFEAKYTNELMRKSL
jgi:mycothiol synthase